MFIPEFSPHHSVCLQIPKKEFEGILQKLAKDDSKNEEFDSIRGASA